MLSEIKQVFLSVLRTKVYLSLPKGHGFAVFPSICDYVVFLSHVIDYAVFPSISDIAAFPSHVTMHYP